MNYTAAARICFALLVIVFVMLLALAWSEFSERSVNEEGNLETLIKIRSSGLRLDSTDISIYEFLRQINQTAFVCLLFYS
jgi:hypothetical protein